jgi:NADH-quinone oxidoreductase subunit D
MEAVIHQFKLVSEGNHPPVGEVYECVESARGELGHYLVSQGRNRPYRLRVRSPSFPHVEVLKKVIPGHILSDVIVAIASVDPILGDVDR